MTVPTPKQVLGAGYKRVSKSCRDCRAGSQVRRPVELRVDPSAAIAPDSLAEHVSRELQEIGVEHAVKVKPRYQVVRGHEEQRIDYSIQGIATFKSVRDFAAALEKADADASYSAGSGWTFTRVTRGTK